jgi:transposase InsO family protein
MCRVLEVSPSGYYAWRHRPESLRARENRKLVYEIKAIHKQNRGVYGSPRIHAELKDRKKQVSKNRVARLMHENNIKAKQKRKYKATTNSNHNHPVNPNLLQRKFDAEAPNQKWLADITFIPTREGWLYLAAILDLYSKMIVGWSMSSRMTEKLVLNALQMAVGRRHPQPGLIHHSDQGCQYASNNYQQKLKSYGMIGSMSRKGNCWDNSPMESWFHSLKTELVMHRDYQTKTQAKADIFEYTEVFYNRSRRHSSLGYMNPEQYEVINMAA